MEEPSGPTLYFNATSFYSQKVLLGMAIKGVAFNEHVIDVKGGETHAPWYMRLNPKGQVPVLQEGKVVVAGSNEILVYLDQQYGTPILVPEPGTPSGDQCLSIVTLLESINIKVLSYGAVLFPDLTVDCQIPEAKRHSMAASVATMGDEDKWKKLAKDNLDLRLAYRDKMTSVKVSKDLLTRDHLLSELTKVKHVLNQIEEQLATANHHESPPGNLWICGSDVTQADIILAILLNRLRMCGFSHLIHDHDNPLPHLARYYEHLHTWTPYQQVCLAPSSSSSSTSPPAPVDKPAAASDSSTPVALLKGTGLVHNQ